MHSLDDSAIYIKRPHSTPFCSCIGNSFVSRKHWQEEIEYVYVKQGYVNIWVDEVTFHVSEGQVFIISSGAVHYFIDASKNSKLCIVKLPISYLTNYSAQNNELILSLYKNTMLITPNTAIACLFEDIIAVPSGALHECFIAVKIMEVTLLVLTTDNLIQEQLHPKTSGDSLILMNMVEYISEHISQKISLKELADHLGFSEAYCSKYIKKKTSLTFVEYLNQTRIVNAEQLLRSSDHSITEVAYAVGFTSIQSFNRVFKSICGVSPTTYRKQLHDNL